MFHHPPPHLYIMIAELVSDIVSTVIGLFCLFYVVMFLCNELPEIIS